LREIEREFKKGKKGGDKGRVWERQGERLKVMYSCFNMMDTC